MQRVVSNSSPLIHLAKIGLINLLHYQFDEVIIPEKVWFEVVEEGGNEPDAKIIAKLNWIKMKTVKQTALLTTLLTFLDEGEAETISLALDEKVDYVLLDETEAREIADELGIRKIGTVGILIKAKYEGRIKKLKPYLNKLQDTGFYLSSQLYNEILTEVGEL